MPLNEEARVPVMPKLRASLMSSSNPRAEAVAVQTRRERFSVMRSRLPG